MELVIIGIGGVVFLAHLFSALFEKTRVPDALPLVFLGLLLGPLLGIVQPEAFGRVGGVFTTLALVIILFQGGLGLNLKVLREALTHGAALTFVNFLATAAVTAPLGVAFLKLSWIEGLMLGAIIGGTSSAIVIPMIEKLALDDRVRTSLFLESAFSDVLCIVVTLALLQSVEDKDLRAGLMAGRIVASFTLASLIGAAGAVFWSLILDKVRRLENSLFTTPAFACIVFGAAELLGFSGAIASLVFGVMLGNIETLTGLRLPLGPLVRLRPIQLNESEKTLFAEIVFLLKTFFFIYIGLSLKFSSWGPAAAGIALAAVAFAVRIPVVRLSLPPSTTIPDASIAAAMVPKGLAAAVLASLPLRAGLERGSFIQDCVYSVVFFSIIITTMLVYLLEKRVISKLYGALLPGFSGEPATAIAGQGPSDKA